MFLDPCQNQYIYIHNPSRMPLLATCRLGLNHLNEHRFSHNFEDFEPFLYLRSKGSVNYSFLFTLSFLQLYHKILLDDLNVADVNISKLSETALTDLLLYGEESFDKIQNKTISIAYIKFVVDSDIFTGCIFWYMK